MTLSPEPRDLRGPNAAGEDGLEGGKGWSGEGMSGEARSGVREEDEGKEEGGLGERVERVEGREVRS